MFQACVSTSACIFLCVYEYIHRVCVYQMIILLAHFVLV